MKVISRNINLQEVLIMKLVLCFEALDKLMKSQQLDFAVHKNIQHVFIKLWKRSNHNGSTSIVAGMDKTDFKLEG